MSRYVGQQFRHRIANHKGEHGDDRNAYAHGQQRVGHITGYQHTCDGTEEEEMHQVHAKRAFGDIGDDGGILQRLDAGEQDERAKGGQQHVGRAELPRPLEHGRLDQCSRHALQPEAPCREHRTDDEANCSDNESALVRPAEMHADIVGEHQIAQIARAIPEHRETIPETLAP